MACAEMLPLQCYGSWTGMIGGEEWLDLSWKEFFRDPSKWWDNRSSKRSSKHPDFKHKVTTQPLWIHSCKNPPWVADELIRRGLAAHQHIEPANDADALSPSLIWSCCKTKDLSRGSRIHHELQKRGIIDQNYSDALVTMYAKCGELHKAQALLEKHNSTSIVPWTALIAGYARHGHGQNALDCFEKMQREGIPPNGVTYLCILKACAVIGAIDKGKEIHNEISRQGLLEQSIVLGNALVDMYAKCGALPQAHCVLDNLLARDVVSWSSLITGYAQTGQGQQALECFEKMQREGIPPNVVTYMGVLKACALIGALDKGKHIHNEVSRQGLLKRNVALGGALVDMYAKCGALLQAQSVLERLPTRDVVSWSALIAGYAQKGQGQHALDCYKQMQREGISPNTVTYLSILKACAAIGAIDKGKEIHDEISRQGLLNHRIELGGALVDMYAKCGALAQAQNILENLPFRNVVLWNALITGYAQKGQGEQVLQCFEQMQHEGIFPDNVTFLCLLNACSHLGLVEKGQELFDSMGTTYGLKPDIECYACMVDLLGRAGHLIKAAEVIQEMPVSANSAIWLCLLGACRRWVDIKVGTWAFEQVIEIDRCDGAYVLMADIYAAAGMLEKAKDIEAMRLEAAKV